MFNIDDVQEFVKTLGQSLSYSAIESYTSPLFELRTGPGISVLQIGDNSDNRILLIGPVNVDSDEDCWKIIMKFRSAVISELLIDVILRAKEDARREGKLDAQIDFRRALGIQ